jgi:hypothetical protein
VACGPADRAAGARADCPADTDSADRADAALADSIDRRRTERRRMSYRPVPARHLAALGEQAARLGAGLVPVTDPTLRQRLGAALTAAAHDQNVSAIK